MFKDPEKIFILFPGRNASQQKATGLFTYVRPKHITEKPQQEALAIPESKKAKMVLDSYAVVITSSHP